MFDVNALKSVGQSVFCLLACSTLFADQEIRWKDIAGYNAIAARGVGPMLKSRGEKSTVLSVTTMHANLLWATDFDWIVIMKLTFVKAFAQIRIATMDFRDNINVKMKSENSFRRTKYKEHASNKSQAETIFFWVTIHSPLNSTLRKVA